MLKVKENRASKMGISLRKQSSLAMDNVPSVPTSRLSPTSVPDLPKWNSPRLCDLADQKASVYSRGPVNLDLVGQHRTAGDEIPYGNDQDRNRRKGEVQRVQCHRSCNV